MIIPKKDAKTPALFGSHNLKIFSAVHKANRRGNVGIGVFKMFPYSASEANRPQRTRTGPK